MKIFKPALWKIPPIENGSETALAEKTETLKHACTRLPAATGMHGLPAALLRKIW